MAAVELDFKISLSTGCCDQLQFCDTTGDFNPQKPTQYCSGYSIIDDGVRTTEIFRSDVASTQFNWVMPDGTKFTAKDLGILPAQYASVTFTLADGSVGDWVIAAIESVSLGQAIFTTSLAQVVYDLVNNINLNSTVTGWYAYYSDYTISIYRLDSDVQYNDNTLEILLNSGTDLVATADSWTTIGGNDSDDCTTLIVTDLYGRFNCPKGVSCWPDGVYTITYIIKNEAGTELARKQKKFFLDCNVSKCIYNQKKRLSAENCNCTDNSWQKVLKLEMTLSGLNDSFNNGDFDCANEGVIDLLDQCKNLCLDC